MEKVDGVESVKVSLNEGFAEVRLKEGNTVTVEQLREVIRKNGFTPKEATVTVAGKVIERNGKPALETGPGAVMLLKGNVAGVAGKGGQRVVVSGVVPASVNKDEPETVEVKTVSAAEG